MAKRPVLIEFHRTPSIAAAMAFFSAAATSMDIGAGLTELPELPGIEIDATYPAVTVPAETPFESVSAMSFAMEPGAVDTTFLVRGMLDEDNIESAFAAAIEHPDVKSIFADPAIEPCLTCINSGAVGTADDVARALCVPQMAANGMNGNGVLLAIVDTGINLDYLRSHGVNPNFNAARSWAPAPPPGSPPLVPGNLPVAHGTMCAFDALIAAPGSTLLDIAVLQSKRPGQTAMEGLLSDAVLGYRFLIDLLAAPRRPGDFHSLVVSNSWGMFQRNWDFPVGHPGNYSDNPDHPFNRIVGTLERAGADILFAAGNCGHECPDSRCGAEIDAGIFGANSHPQVICVAGVDLNGDRVGYSTRGPGHLEKQKPDISSYTHFRGSGVFPVDGGTSAATPVAAGVVAALRTRFPSGPSATPAMLRNLLTRIAVDKGQIGFDEEYGWGVINGCRLANITSLTASPTLAALNDPFARDSSSSGIAAINEAQFMEALADFEQPDTRATAGDDVCGLYRKVKPILQGILRFVELIPTIGKPAARAIRSLMAALDSFCGSPGPESAFTTFNVVNSSAADESFMQALSTFEQAGADAVAGASDLCGTFRKVRPILKGILPFIELIPRIGKPAAAAITALIAALDGLCTAP